MNERKLGNIKNRIGLYATAMRVVLAMLCESVAVAEGPKPPESRPAVAGVEVTLTGVMMSNDICTRTAPADRDAQLKVPVLLALDGTAEVSAAYKEIMKDLIAGNSINYDQAKTIEEEMDKRLKYYITPGAIVDAIKGWSSKSNGGGCTRAVTGIVSEKDGKRWITASKIEPLKAVKGNVHGIIYPEGFFAADTPFLMPGKDPLLLEITDKLSMKCILLPAGKYMIGSPYYLQPRWDDEKPHSMTLTKPFWLAECPVTQEMWDLVMTNNPSTVKNPQLPVRNVTFATASEFCRILSEKDKRKVRLPGEGEWEWACRVGTSNPPFRQKYNSQDSKGPVKGECLPVKSKQPNSWGLYDMVSGCWEMTRDEGYAPFHFDDAVDPDWTVTTGKKIQRIGKGGLMNIDIHENCGNTNRVDADYGSCRFRILVEATPEEIAEMEKMTKK